MVAIAVPLDEAPVLEPGDRLRPEEFDRRYEARPDIHKAELIDGIVYMPSPVRIRQHGTPHSVLNYWATGYALTHGDCEAATDATVILGDDRLQPDILLRWTMGGTSTINDDGYIEGPPELVIEVAASSAAYDLHVKKEALRRAGVQEYIVWRTRDAAVDWFTLDSGLYVPLQAEADGVTRSRVFPGLALDLARLANGDPAAVLG